MPQVACTFDAKRAIRSHLDYLLYLPVDYGHEPDRQWPLILFLHGAGERGGDLSLLRVHGIPRVVEEQPDFPFITVSPQCPRGAWWDAYIRILKPLLDEVVATHAVDPDRIYLTGMSMGGYATWHLAVRYPEQFAAIAPICGGGLQAYGFPQAVCAIKDVPVWAFHGARDDIVPIEESERVVQALRACGGDVQLTVYPELGHDSWTRTYANPELYEWFLSHPRSDHRAA